VAGDGVQLGTCVVVVVKLQIARQIFLEQSKKLCIECRYNAVTTKFFLK
jgi:hypothetical protein